MPFTLVSPKKVDHRKSSDKNQASSALSLLSDREAHLVPLLVLLGWLPSNEFSPRSLLRP